MSLIGFGLYIQVVVHTPRLRSLGTLVWFPSKVQAICIVVERVVACEHRYDCHIHGSRVQS